MTATERELATARRLSDALVHFLIAIEDGAAQRRSGRPQEQLTVCVEQPPSPQVPAPPPPVPAAPTTHMPDRMLVTAREAARLLSIGERKLWEITAPRGPIPAVRLGRAVRYPVEDLAKAISKMNSRR